jgi:enediyne biosynthesis protein E4
MPETMGSGCAFLDFDGDGWLDILLLNGRPLRDFGLRTADFGLGINERRTTNDHRPTTGGSPPESAIRNPQSAIPTAALYHNNRDGTFTDVTAGSGLDIPLCAMGCCVGDYDNDGREDLFITTCLEPNRLFHNEGGGKFRDVTGRAGVGDTRWGTSCAWVDYDRDGWLDLFVCNYVRFRSLSDDRYCSLVAGRKSYCPPTAYRGEACILYRNHRDGTFRDVSRETGIGQHIGYSLGVAILDYDDDGWPDIAVANDESPNYLFHNMPVGGAGTGDGRPEPEDGRPKNEDRRSRLPSLVSGPGAGGRRFQEIGVEAGFAVAETGKPKAGMGIDAADYLANGSLGVLVSNFSNEGLSFFRRQGGLFSEESFAAGFGPPSLLTLGFGLFFFDMDNDGFQDAFVANGHINDDIQLVQSNVGYGEKNLLFRNRRDGSFVEIGGEAGPPFGYAEVSRGAACGDFDNDGRLDILLTNNGGRAELLRNESRSSENWLEVEVRGAGPRGGTGSNVSGIGARVRVRAGGRILTGWVRSGSSYLSQGMLRRHFGLGKADRADWIEITWPGGHRQRVENVKANQKIVVEEARGVVPRRSAP